MLLDAFIGHKANVHPARHLLGALVPAPVRRRCDRAGSAAGRSTERDCGGTRQERPASWGSEAVRFTGLDLTVAASDTKRARGNLAREAHRCCAGPCARRPWA